MPTVMIAIDARRMPASGAARLCAPSISSRRTTAALTIFLVLKEFEPTFTRGGDMDMDFLSGNELKALKEKGEAAMKASTKAGTPKGYEVGYQFFTINGHVLGDGEPIRAKKG